MVGKSFSEKMTVETLATKALGRAGDRKGLTLGKAHSGDNSERGFGQMSWIYPSRKSRGKVGIKTSRGATIASGMRNSQETLRGSPS